MKKEALSWQQLMENPWVQGLRRRLAAGQAPNQMWLMPILVGTGSLLFPARSRRTRAWRALLSAAATAAGIGGLQAALRAMSSSSASQMPAPAPRPGLGDIAAEGLRELRDTAKKGITTAWQEVAEGARDLLHNPRVLIRDPLSLLRDSWEVLSWLGSADAGRNLLNAVGAGAKGLWDVTGGTVLHEMAEDISQAPVFGTLTNVAATAALTPAAVLAGRGARAAIERYRPTSRLPTFGRAATVREYLAGRQPKLLWGRPAMPDTAEAVALDRILAHASGARKISGTGNITNKLTRALVKQPEDARFLQWLETIRQGRRRFPAREQAILRNPEEIANRLSSIAARIEATGADAGPLHVWANKIRSELVPAAKRPRRGATAAALLLALLAQAWFGRLADRARESMAEGRAAQ